MRHTEIKAALCTLLLLFLAVVISLPGLGTMIIEDIDYSTVPTASVYRISLPLKGLSYLSMEKMKAEAMIRMLPYVGAAASSFSDGGMVFDLTFRDGGILAVANDGARLVFADGSAAVALEDLSVLMDVYPSVCLTDEAMEFFNLFGFDYGALGKALGLASSTPEAIDDNVYDEGAAVSSVGIEG